VIWALLVIVAIFVVLGAVRLAGAERDLLLRRWPSVALGLAAVLVLWRGLWGPAVVLGGLAWLAWIWPRSSRVIAAPRNDSADREARLVLGVGPNATGSEIRTAYRERMRSAHPDQGGSHAQAAKLTAARDYLLRRRR
jgi:chromate transport protein ChrA